MNVLIIDNGSIHLTKLVRSLSSEYCSVISCKKITPQEAIQFDCMVISGSSKYPLRGHEETYGHIMSIVTSFNGPILGICLGCEIIAAEFGGKLERMDKKEHGMRDISLTRKDAITQNLPNTKVYEAHRWHIAKLFSRLVGLAESNTGFEVIKHKSKPIYGFQFHPELYVKSTCGKQLIDNFLQIGYHLQEGLQNHG